MVVQPARRSALRRLAVGAPGLATVAAGLIAWGSRRPEARLLSLLCQADGGPVKRNVLVAYATRAGSTAEVAQAIGARLGELGFDDGGHLLVGHDAPVQAEVLELLATVARP